VDEAYDEARAQLAAAGGALGEYQRSVRQLLGGGSQVALVTLNGTTVIEVPESLDKRVPRDFELAGQRKGFKRYTCAPLKAALGQQEEADAAATAALDTILLALVRRFVERRDLWLRAVDAVAELDALASLASAALHADGPVCRPRFVHASEGEPVFAATQLRHPAATGVRGGAFVPNDVALGGPGGAPPFLVLTGPNMGGKSTMLRQVCLAAMLAQVGAWVPAAGLTLTPVDAVFVRMGARDHILTGQSTFFVELSETAAMLSRASRQSLVALDELGRGTATSDGAAIAAAVLRHLAASTACRGLFATHYHSLAGDHAADGSVSIMHMACAVAPPAGGRAGDPEEVTFLYTLAAGACPKSYGTNVARLAGLPASVVRRAAEISSRLDGSDAGAGAAAAAAKAVAAALDGAGGRAARLAALQRGL